MGQAAVLALDSSGSQPPRRLATPRTRFTLRFRDTVGHPPEALLEPRPAQMGQQLISENDGRQQGRNGPSQVTQNRG